MVQTRFDLALLYLDTTAGTGPKKAMKAMKKLSVKTVKKASEKAKTKGKALGKAKAKGKPNPKNSINKTNLEKLGRMSLDDKVKAAAGRYQTYNKNNPEEKDRVDTLSKKKKE